MRNPLIFKPSEPEMNRRLFCQSSALASGLLVLSTDAEAQPQANLTITNPLPRQVMQREGYEPAHAYDHVPGGPKLGFANVTVKGGWKGPAPVRLEARTTVLEGCSGKSIEWKLLGEISLPGDYQFQLQIPAGGWYRLEVRAVNASGAIVGSAQVAHVGVGEVFLISGQSYAAGANDELLKIDDPLERTVLFDWVTKSWRTANDPFPHVDSGGTIWPAFANTLQPILQVPIGLVNVAVGGTSTRQWMPGEALFHRFSEGGQAVGRFRYVLWQQGESDVIENIPTATYVERLQTIQKALAKQWGFSPRWLLAKSTLHPTVYKKPVEEARIRAAIDQLWRVPGFGRGPDTDILNGENRGGIKSRRHFSPIGQRRAGLMWFASVWAALNEELRPSIT
jgi:hypothetical protein